MGRSIGKFRPKAWSWSMSMLKHRTSGTWHIYPKNHSTLRKKKGEWLHSSRVLESPKITSDLRSWLILRAQSIGHLYIYISKEFGLECSINNDVSVRSLISGRVALKRRRIFTKNHRGPGGGGWHVKRPQLRWFVCFASGSVSSVRLWKTEDRAWSLKRHQLPSWEWLVFFI